VYKIYFYLALFRAFFGPFWGLFGAFLTHARCVVVVSMSSAKVQRDAVALVVLAHKRVDFSPTVAARLAGGTKQRFAQRLNDAVGWGWLEKGAKPRSWKLTPRGVLVVEQYRKKLSDLEKIHGKLNLAEIMAGSWAEKSERSPG
jgi:hypothetical protein